MLEPLMISHGPITFKPILMERPWGGRLLETEFHITLPKSTLIGELWALVDRSEAQSIVENGPLQGKTLHQLWNHYRVAIFGSKHLRNSSSSFPLLCKILDATEMLSLQVHPRATTASKLRGEPKTEFWFFLKTDVDAFCYAGLKKGVTRTMFECSLKNGTLNQVLHCINVKTGDSLFIPSGRLHALGKGNLVIEIQQNSDTTYRVFDWNRRDSEGRTRTLHFEEAMESIDFEDEEPSLQNRDSPMISNYFHSEKWNLSISREITTSEDFAIITCLTGEIECQGMTFHPGDFFLLPALQKKFTLTPLTQNTSFICTRLPS